MTQLPTRPNTKSVAKLDRYAEAQERDRAAIRLMRSSGVDFFEAYSRVLDAADSDGRAIS